MEGGRLPPGIALIQANMSHRLTADQFVVGLTANVLVLGLAGYLDDLINPIAKRAAINGLFGFQGGVTEGSRFRLGFPA